MWPRCKGKDTDGLERMAERLRHDMRQEDVGEVEEKDIHYMGLTGKKKAGLEVTALRVFQLATKMTKWMKRIINEYIMETAGVEKMGVKMRESLLRCYGHVFY